MATPEKILKALAREFREMSWHPPKTFDELQSEFRRLADTCEGKDLFEDIEQGDAEKALGRPKKETG